MEYTNKTELVTGRQTHQYSSKQKLYTNPAVI